VSGFFDQILVNAASLVGANLWYKRDTRTKLRLSLQSMKTVVRHVGTVNFSLATAIRMTHPLSRGLTTEKYRAALSAMADRSPLSVNKGDNSRSNTVEMLVLTDPG
jgi:ribosome biogenesis SPOUT family RNA methylase Rps3